MRIAGRGGPSVANDLFLNGLDCVIGDAQCAASACSVRPARRRKSRSASRLWNTRRLSISGMPPPGFIEPCLPSPADLPPSGSNWIHGIKHDGYRLMARRDSVGIRLLTRNGHDWAPRYPLIVEAVNRLKVRSCLIDGEAVACDENGLAARRTGSSSRTRRLQR